MSQSQPTACILCAQNCGIRITVNDERKFAKITRDNDHPVSQGYVCPKANQLNFYQNQARLTSPLRKKADGSFEEISWQQATKEIAEKLVAIRNEHGGKTIAFAGGGGQGNHIGGVYSTALRAACDTPYLYTALAQEKTGNFWVNGKLFGKQNTNYSEPVAEADYVLIVGSNPMRSHGFPKAQKEINNLAKDPNRKLVVIDPRNTETAKKADLHIAVKPGKDAWLLSALLGEIVQQKYYDQKFISERTQGFEKIKPHFDKVPVGSYAKQAGVSIEIIQQLAKEISLAKTVAVRSDLGLEQSFNSTLNAYLIRLLFLVTGHFGRKGTNCLHTMLLPVIGHSKEPSEGGIVTPVTGMKEIGKVFPPNILPQEINTDHPDRMRALIVESTNPVYSYADSNAQSEALQKLDLLVVIDVAMTETAAIADYVLPAASQYEKLEATFFNIEFPANFFHLRDPILKPLANTRAEPDIYKDIVCAMGEMPQSFPLLSAIAKLDRKMPMLRLYPAALAATLKLKPKLKKYAALILKQTLGKALPEGKEAAAVLWMAAHMYAKKHSKAVQRIGLSATGYQLGEQLFNRIINSPSGTLLSVHNHDEHWKLMRHKDKKVHLVIEEMLTQLDQLAKQQNNEESDYPFNLIAGERRAFTANSILRNPKWRKKETLGTLKINPENATALNIESDDWIKCSSTNGSIKIQAEVTEDIPANVVSMAHGYGLHYQDIANDEGHIGAGANMLTDHTHCDPLSKTPYHKNVAVKLEKIS